MSLSSSAVGGKTKYKLVLLGDQQVGKTSIIDRFINDRFETSYNATIGIDFLVKNLTYNNRSYRLQLWDTAGQQRFKSLIPSYLKDSNICLLVYDIGSLESFDHLASWLELYNQHKEYSAFSVIVGNKRDITTKQCTDQALQERLKQFKDMKHFAISAKTGAGVTQLFNQVITLIGDKLSNIKIIEQIDQKEEKDQKSVEAHTSKPVLELSNKKKEGIKLEKGNAVKKCC